MDPSAMQTWSGDSDARVVSTPGTLRRREREGTIKDTPKNSALVESLVAVAAERKLQGQRAPLAFW